ncbi:MAG: hypothetical protein AAGB22_13065, partial [Bacteroidota bacterium]
RSVSVSMLGLMNVDYSMPLRQFTRVLASYSDKDSNGDVAMNDICVLEDQVNSARFYTPESLYLDLRKNNVMLGVSEQDELWLFDASDFAASSLKPQTGGKLRYHFPMRNLGKPGSLEEVRQALTFQ